MEGQYTEQEQNILKNYNYHKPSGATQEIISDMRRSFKSLAERIMKNVKNSRERSLALTHLEDARMYSILALAVNDPDGEVVPDTEPSGMSGAQN